MQLLVGMKILAAGAGYRSSILYEENPSIHSTGTYRIKFNTSLLIQTTSMMTDIGVV